MSRSQRRCTTRFGSLGILAARICSPHRNQPPSANSCARADWANLVSPAGCAAEWNVCTTCLLGSFGRQCRRRFVCLCQGLVDMDLVLGPDGQPQPLAGRGPAAMYWCVAAWPQTPARHLLRCFLRAAAIWRKGHLDRKFVAVGDTRLMMRITWCLGPTRGRVLVVTLGSSGMDDSPIHDAEWCHMVHCRLRIAEGSRPCQNAVVSAGRVWKAKHLDHPVTCHLGAMNCAYPSWVMAAMPANLQQAGATARLAACVLEMAYTSDGQSDRCAFSQAGLHGVLIEVAVRSELATRCWPPHQRPCVGVIFLVG